jgi:catechol 2,3-dioxygenase-like lactoylglutathione lyase family enzyme
MLFDHADLRVSDLAKVRGLYDALLPAMGFTTVVEAAGSVCYYSPGDARSAPFFGLEVDPSHRPNNSRLAFRANSRAEVDRLAGIAQAHGAKSFEPAELCEEYIPLYYATFFEDADGNKLEVCFREMP